MEEGRRAFKILEGKSTGNRPLGRLRLRWEDSVTMYLKEIGVNANNLVDLSQDKDYCRALVNAAFIKPLSLPKT